MLDFDFPSQAANLSKVSREGGFGSLEQDFVTMAMFFRGDLDLARFSRSIYIGFITMAMLFLELLSKVIKVLKVLKVLKVIKVIKGLSS